MRPVFIIRFFFAVTIILSATGSVFSQNYGPEWGGNASTEQRRRNAANFELFTNAYIANRYSEALALLPDILRNSPKGSQDIYAYAINMYRTNLQTIKDTSVRNGMLDSLFGLYDRQLTIFGVTPATKSVILKQRAKDYLALIPLDREGVRKSFAEAVDADRDNPDPEFITLYFSELTNDYMARTIGASLYIDNYAQLSSLIEKAASVTAAETRNAAANARRKLDEMFAASGANDCGTIERAYKKLLAEKPNDETTLADGFALLTQLGCNSLYYFELGDAILSLRPTVDMAAKLAKDYGDMGNLRKSAEYYRMAVNIEKDPAAKSNLCVNISSTLLSSGDLQGSAEFARQASVYNPKNGNAYIAQAKAYAEGASGCGDFDRQAVNWLAYDLVMEALRLTTGNSAEMKKVNDILNTYRAGFPSKEELFFRWLSEGETYEINCGWIKGTTTVREGK